LGHGTKGDTRLIKRIGDVLHLHNPQVSGKENRELNVGITNKLLLRPKNKKQTNGGKKGGVNRKRSQ